MKPLIKLDETGQWAVYVFNEQYARWEYGSPACKYWGMPIRWRARW